nr:probable LRR receptor-like serine/threonine-protein kinase At3g47570 [Ipomoea trifida]
MSSSLFFFYALFAFLCKASFSLPGNVSDHTALLSLKANIIGDPLPLQSWNHSTHFCNWVGITCARKHQRVVTIDLGSSNLQGSLSPAIGNLSFLRELWLDNNTLAGSTLPNLKSFFIGDNLLRGRLPISMSNTTTLRYFDVRHNDFYGGVPSFSGLKTLKFLSLLDNPLGNGKSTDLDFMSSLLNSTATLVFLLLDNCNFGGVLPRFIGNFSSLEGFFIAENVISGTISSEIRLLVKLQQLDLSENQLGGTIPSTWGGSLKQLIGEIPTEGIFKNKTEVELGGNSNLCGEYGMGSDLSIFGDMYSYGILLLEIFTSKSPTSDIFNNGLTLHNYVRMSVPEQVIEIVDPKLFNEEANATPRSLVLQNQIIECLVSIFKIGISCSMELPRDRMSIGNAVKELHSIKDTLVRGTRRQ